MKRLFLAIPLPQDMLNSLAEWQGSYKNQKNIRWTPQENLHITAAFLGDIEEERISELIRELDIEIKEIKPFGLEFKEMVLAPPGRKPRMIWADFYGCSEFNDLLKKIWSVAANYTMPDVAANIKEPAIHVTICRFRQPIYLSGLKQPDIKDKRFEVNKIELMESELTPQRPYYKVIKEFYVAREN